MYVTMATSNLSLINDSTNCQIYENHDSKFSMRSFILNKIARDSTFMVYVTTTRIEVYSKNKSSMYIVDKSNGKKSVLALELGRRWRYRIGKIEVR